LEGIIPPEQHPEPVWFGLRATKPFEPIIAVEYELHIKEKGKPIGTAGDKQSSHAETEFVPIGDNEKGIDVVLYVVHSDTHCAVMVADTPITAKIESNIFFMLFIF
jgi:hypothetical protein